MNGVRIKSKETNTFRFKTFADRVNEIDIRQSTLYRIGHENEEVEGADDETLFSYTLRKWSVLNLSVEYSNFTRKCQGIVTLPQLLYKREHVVTVLLESLETSTTLSLEPILDVLTAFARDIREEFYQHFEDFLAKLVHLLHTKDSEQLEWTLKCLAQLFKTLKPYLKRNIGVVLSRVVPLLDDASNPDYVVNFASECFSFVARDIKDYEKFLTVTLKYLKKHNTGYSGCGKLFFELIRGVNGNFHSVAKDFLRSLLEGFASFVKDRDLLFEVTTRTVAEILEHISVDNFALFWDAIGEAAEKSFEELHKDPGALLCIVRLMRQAVDWWSGRAITDVGQLISLLVKIVDHVESDDILLELVAVCTVILQSNSVKLQQMDASRLICKMLSVSSAAIYEQFVWNICQHPQYEILVQPNLLNYFEKEPSIKRLNLLVRILEKRLGRNVQDVWKKHPIKLKRPQTIDWIQRNIGAFKPNKSTGHELEAYILSTMLYPHLLEGGDSKRISQLLQKKVLSLDFKQTEAESASIAAYTSILAIFALDVTMTHTFLDQLMARLLESACKDVATLVIFLIIFNHAINKKKNLFTEDLFMKLHEKLRDNLCSSNYLIRLLTAKILSQFAGLKELNSIYSIFHEAASIKPTVHNYREQLLLLQKFSPNGQIYPSIQSDAVKQDCVRLLLGLLYENFKLVWDPVSKHIEELAEKLPADDFWAIYHCKLGETNSSIWGHSSLRGKTENNFESEAIKDLFQQLWPTDDKVDHVHYRSLLWKNLPNFGLLSEVKNKDIVSLFLDFVENEYRKEDKGSILTWNLTIDEGHGDYTDADESIRKHKRGKVDGHKSVGVTLAIMLGVFTKMANPKQLYREPEIRELYYELLAGTNEQLQKLSLDCLMRYKIKGCVPYKDRLYALIDDKKFRDELITLKLDADSKMVDPDHRAELMPILLRILYGRMRSKTGNKYVGGQMRRSIILRFLAGCRTDEILWFLQMAFCNYRDLLECHVEMIPSKITNNFNLKQVLSPKKLQSALNLLDMTRKSFGGLMEKDFLIYLFKLIVLAGTVCRSVFEKTENVNGNLLKVFRNLRAQCLQSLVAFFEHFEELAWQSEHLKVCFQVFVWPSLHKLPDECLHSPTPLLKLFITWSQNVRNYKLLAEKDKDGATPLGTAVLLLISDKPSKLVRKTVLDMIERILIMEEEENRDRQKEPSIITPYIAQILQRLTQVLNTKGSRRNFGKTELFILSKITDMDLPADMCDMLLILVLPIATGKARVLVSDLGISQLVTTLRNLLLKTARPEHHVRSIMPLFEKVTDIATRKQLCKLFTELYKKSGKSSEYLLELAEVAAKLNAWDRKWIEQPDYDKRLSALRDIREKAENSKVGIELGLLVIHNCFYFLNHDKDLGLRDNACLCMRSLVPKLIIQHAENPKEVNYLLEDVMFNLIRRTLRDKNDVIRNEGILLLGEMASNCPDMHQVLKDLQPLSCKEDLEVDFFENLTHLQSHRHGRALLKFCAYAKECEKPISSRTLTNFLLPLTTRYLLSEKAAAKHTLVDAAIETLGMICRFLPWHQYHTVLKYYLRKMQHCHEYHKQCIRIIISILDAFHFDLSSANGVPLQQVSNNTVQKGQGTQKNEEDEENTEDEEEKDEDLDSELDELAEEDDDDDDQPHIVPAKKNRLSISFVEQLTRLSPSATKNVIQTITSNLIPSLNHSITALSSYESKHKLNRRRVNLEREEEESLRVPIALAIAKLLKKLPKDIFQSNIAGVFLKACTFLKSPVKSVRMLTRDILKKMMTTVGPEYLSMLLSQLTVLLTRGFQVHVLSVTLFGILDCLKADLKPQHVESALRHILDVTLNDIFGDASVEKEIEKIGSATPEAKPSAKSYLSLQITAQCMPENCLLDLLVPFKDHLYKTQSKKVVVKIQDCFQKIISGLAENPNVTSESLLQFIYGMVSQSIPELLLPETKLAATEKELIKRRQPDCFLIPQEPKSRSGAVRKTVKTNASANAYVLIEFGLELLHILLRRKKFDSSDCLEPFVSMLQKSLDSTHLRTCILSLKCLITFWTSGTELESLKEHIDSIVTQTFAILHKYFNFGVTRKDDNFQLVKNAMKAVGCIIKNCEYYEVSDDHVMQLLFYVGQDVNESDRQPVAFSLLKSLIERHKNSKEIHEIMLKLCEISITSESTYSQNEARSVLLNYATEFSREKRVESILKFFIAQLNYEVIAGRISAVKFIESSVKKYPGDVMNKKAELIFLALGTRLVNEDVPECRMLIAQTLEQLISRLGKVTRQKLFEIATTFFESEKAAVKELGASLCSRFTEVEKTEFLPRALLLLPTLATNLELSSPNAPGKFVRATVASDTLELNEKENDTKKNERVVDHSIIQIQNCIIKILANCPQVFAENSLTNTIDCIAYESQKLLGYDHDWVRLNSVIILNHLLATYDARTLKVALEDDESENVRQFICCDPASELKSLALDLCAQMVPGEINEDIAQEISKTLLFIASIILSTDNLQSNDSLGNVSLHWLLRRVRYALHGEVAKAPKSTVLRQSLFDWFECLITLLDVQQLIDHCPAMVASLVREISEDDSNIDQKVKQKAIKITNKIRKKIGDENYDRIRLETQTKLILKRAARKKELAQEKILDPIRSAKRKSSQQERKKLAKRRKIDAARGKSKETLNKKRKRKSLDDVF